MFGKEEGVMRGIVDVGGGFRGIYAAGVLDRCMDEGVTFDVGIGVSAGSANVASFISRQKGRNYRFYTEYGTRWRYASLRNFLLKRSFIDMDYVYGTLSNSDGEDPVDFAAFKANPMDLVVVAAEAETGAAKYFTKDDVRHNDLSPLKASSAIPAICKPYEVNGIAYFDGALADPVPVKHAFELGCDQVVVILTKPRDLIRAAAPDIKLARFIERRYPCAARALCARAERYNQGVDEAKRLEAEGCALIVAPADTCGVSTLTRNRPALDALYAEGYADGATIAAFIS